MVNFCKDLLDRKDEFTHSRKAIHEQVYNHLFNVVFNKTLHFKLSNTHVKNTFRIMDKLYFNNRISDFIKDSGSTLAFNATSRLTKTAGCCKYKYYCDEFDNVKSGTFELQISKPIIENLFNDPSTEALKINGLHCYNKLQCYVNLFQHEIIHLVIAIFCPKEGETMGGHTRTFKQLVFYLFGHTDYKHMLLHGDSVQYDERCNENKQNVNINDTVEFVAETVQYSGTVIKKNCKTVTVCCIVDGINTTYNVPYGCIANVIVHHTQVDKNDLKLNSTIQVLLKGTVYQGTILNLGKKRASVLLANGKKWYIPYSDIVSTT